MRIVVVILLILIVSPFTASATSQCPEGAECEVPIEVKVTFLAMAEVLRGPCIKLDSENEELYLEAYQLLNKEFSEAARGHEKYNEAQDYYTKLVSEMSDRSLRRECNGFMKEILKEAENL
ncbi:hypothetical protein [Kangiella sp.]|uniref:hypothetical protein n=1 Tax=Kangiella sp. TaxID=1920245 RepID=UPI0019AE2224|nr:hypothetical protein [Kangiella sp.]MBD3653111.1 hypothetical protein [Kangiella sp.]